MWKRRVILRDCKDNERGEREGYKGRQCPHLALLCKSSILCGEPWRIWILALCPPTGMEGRGKVSKMEWGEYNKSGESLSFQNCLLRWFAKDRTLTSVLVPQGCVTNCYKLGVLLWQKLLSHSFGGQDSSIKASESLCLRECPSIHAFLLVAGNSWYTLACRCITPVSVFIIACCSYVSLCTNSLFL